MPEYEGILDLDDEQIDEYLELTLSNGFSKGTANVDPHDMKKLRPLLKYYRKKPHPFRACVRDNKKRFGPATNAMCAVVKDLIFHSTKWRNKSGKKLHAAMANDDEFLAFASTVPDEFYTWLEEVTDEEVGEMLELAEAADDEASLEWDEDERTWKVKELELSEAEAEAMGEIFLASTDQAKEKKGLVWKTILREGTWKVSPVGKPMKILVDGKSDYHDSKAVIVSMSELLKNFHDGVMEHVTVPLSHENEVIENTGFIRELKMIKGKDGKHELLAGIDFTEPDVKDKVLRGTIANISSGVMYDYRKKDSGEKFGAVLGHAALTNSPWLNGMTPFGVEMADDVEILAFSEELDGSEPGGGGKKVPDLDTEKTLEELLKEEGLDLSIDEIKAEVEGARKAKLELAERKERDREKDVEEWIKEREEEKKSPAMLKIAERILLKDTEEANYELNLSEDGKGKDREVTLSDVVKKLVEVSPSINLTDKAITAKDLTADEPEGNEREEHKDEEGEELKLSAAEKAEAAHLYLYENLSEEDAAKEAKRRLAAKSQ